MFKKLNKFVCLQCVMALSLLTACTSPEEALAERNRQIEIQRKQIEIEQQRVSNELTSNKEKCKRFGYKEKTDAYANCLQVETIRSEERWNETLRKKRVEQCIAKLDNVGMCKLGCADIYSPVFRLEPTCVSRCEETYRLSVDSCRALK